MATTITNMPILASICAGYLCGIIGPYLLWRRLSMFSSSISHAAMTPVAIAHVFGLPTFLVLYPFSAMLSLGITRAEERGLFESDSILTLFFAGFMALGVLILASTGAESEEALHYLFGEISSMSPADYLLLVSVTFLVLIYVLKNRRELALLCLNRDLAISEGVPVRRHIYILNLLAAITVVCLLSVMGIILATALLVGPALIAASMSKSLKAMLAWSVAIGVACSLGGLVLSGILGWSSGSTIAVLTLTFFLISLLFKKGEN